MPTEQEIDNLLSNIENVIVEQSSLRRILNVRESLHSDERNVELASRLYPTE